MTTSINATGTSLLQLHYTVFGSAPTLAQLNSYAGDYNSMLAKGESAAEARAGIVTKILGTEAAINKYLPNLTTPSSQATIILSNLGITNAGIVSFVASALDGSGGFGTFTLTQAVVFLTDYVSTYTAGNLKDTAWDSAVLAGKAKMGGVMAPSVTPIQTAFTVNTDSLMGTAADETFVAAAGTWTAGDKVDGGTGNDTLNLTLTGTAAAGTISGIEVVNITATPNPATIDMSGVAGVTQINNANSANGASLTVNNVAAAVSTTITGGNSATTVNYGTAVTAATATTDAATVTLAGVSAGSSYVTAGIETLTLNSTTAANTLTTLTDTGITKLVIGGDKALTITNAVGGTTIGSVDASALKAALTMTAGAGAGGTAATGVTVTGPADAAATLDLTTGANKDTITIGAGKATVVAGAGNDTITVGGGDALITPGAGNDVVNLGAGAETIRFAEVGGTSADTLQNFGATDVIALNIGAAAVTGTNAAAASANTTFGVVPTGATSPVMQNVAGTATTNAVSFQAIAPNATATVGTVLGTSNVIALNGVYTDGTATGVVNALGTSATTGITTTTTGRFLLVTYSVGNIAQVWSYGGDTTTADTNIEAGELSLVATLNGVTLSSLTAANFATYLTPVAAATTVSNTGQTINLSGLLNTVQSVANASGQYLTAAADTINVGVGTMPAGNGSATVGLTIIDPGVGDGDVLNATNLVAGGLVGGGTLIAGIETINLNMLVANTTFSAAAITPGTTTFGLTGTQNFTVTGMPNGGGVTLGAGYTGQASYDVISAAGTSDTFIINLNGATATSATAGASAIYANGGAAAIETTTVNVNSASSIRLAGTGLLGAVADSTAVNLAGSGNLTVYGSPGALGTTALNGAGAAYTGSLTISPTGTPAAMDFSATGVISGVRTIDLSGMGAAPPLTSAETITLPAVATGANLTISNAPTGTATVINNTGLTVVQLGSSLNDTLTVSLGANATGNLATGGISATGTESLIITNAGLGTTTTAIAGITLADAAGNQSVTVSGAGNYTLGTVVADTLNTTGVTGTVTAVLGNTTGGAAFTGGVGATTITGTALADNITTGIGSDSITGGAGADLINVGSAGTDTIVLAAASLTGINAGAAQTAQADVVTGATLGTGGDVINISLTMYGPGAALNSLAITNGNDGAVLVGASVVQVIPAATATTIAATTNVIAMTSTYANSAALLAAIGGTAALTLQAANPTNHADYVIVWSDGVNSHVGLINDADAAGAAVLAAVDLTYTELATLIGVTATSGAVAANFNFIT